MITSLFNSNSTIKNNFTSINNDNNETKSLSSYRQTSPNYKNDYIANRIMSNKSASNEIIRILISNNSFPYINRRLCVYETENTNKKSSFIVNNKEKYNKYKSYDVNKNILSKVISSQCKELKNNISDSDIKNKTKSNTYHTLSLSSNNSQLSKSKTKSQSKKIIFSNLKTKNERLVNSIIDYSNETNEKMKANEKKIKTLTSILMTIQNEIKEKNEKSEIINIRNRKYKENLLKTNQKKTFLDLYNNENSSETKNINEYIMTNKEITSQYFIENKVLLLEKDEEELKIKKINSEINELNNKIREVNDNKRHIKAYISFVYKNIQKLKRKNDEMVRFFYIII